MTKNNEITTDILQFFQYSAVKNGIESKIGCYDWATKLFYLDEEKINCFKVYIHARGNYTDFKVGIYQSSIVATKLSKILWFNDKKELILTNFEAKPEWKAAYSGRFLHYYVPDFNNT